MSRKIILSLCDFSGEWSRPYAEAGNEYDVIRVDPKIPGGKTVQEFEQSEEFANLAPFVVGILMAPPCTHFSVSGAQYWPAKDEDGRTAKDLEIVDTCLRIKDRCKNLVWWVLENPVGRLPTLRPKELGRPKMYVQPYYFAGFADDPERERYTKKTGLWGDFNANLPHSPLEPIKVCEQGSWIQKLGGSSEKTKELRSMTPQGFARSFYEANK